MKIMKFASLAGSAAAAQTRVNLASFFNNKAAAIEGTLGNFDGHNGSYPAEYLPSGVLVDATISVRIVRR